MRIIMKTDIGMKRTNNEDMIQTVFNHQKQPLMILCDGVGGQNFGEIAANMCVTYLVRQWEKTSDMTPEKVQEWLDKHITIANNDIYEKGEMFSDLKGMSTTLVCATAFENQLIVAHVGDSRAYIYRYPELRLITQDHSLVNYLLEKGEISEENAKIHPMRNVITRAIGTQANVPVDFTQVSLMPKDSILLCSDGLSDMISEIEMSDILKQNVTLFDQSDRLVKSANQNGGRDNISLILARYDVKEGGE